MRWPVLQELKPEGPLCLTIHCLGSQGNVLLWPTFFIRKSGLPGKPLSEGYLEEEIISHMQIAASTVTVYKSLRGCSYY